MRRVENHANQIAPTPEVVGRRGDALGRLLAAREKVAQLVVDDPVYAPIFARLEDEIARAEALQSGDLIERARALSQSAKSRTTR